MLTLLLRKMYNTKWMVICLALGFIMASAMMSTIPIYMNASLQRMLVKDMEAYQSEMMKIRVCILLNITCRWILIQIVKLKSCRV